MQIISATKNDIKKAVKVLRQGGVVSHLTDTVWGLACDATNQKAIAKIHTIKKSPNQKSLLVIVPSKSYITKIARVTPAAKTLIKEFLPGPLALVLPDKRGGTVGIRYPAHKLSLKLARELCRPIVTTSANLHGKPPIASAAELLKIFGKRKLKPDLALSDSSQKTQTNKPSTIVDCTTYPPRVLRAGAVSAQKVARALSRQALRTRRR